MSYLVFEGNFPSAGPLKAYIWRARDWAKAINGGFLRYEFGGLIFRGAYTWGGGGGGVARNFTATGLFLLGSQAEFRIKCTTWSYNMALYQCELMLSF